jgi:hypothetical protein
MTPVVVRVPATASSHARSIAPVPGQFTGQCRMQVDHAVGEPAEEAHREDPHPPGQHDEVGVESGDHVGETGVVVGAVLAGMDADVDGGDTGSVGSLQREHLGSVRHDGDDLGGQAFVGAGIDDRLQIGAAAGHEHHEPLRSDRTVGLGGRLLHVSNLAMPTDEAGVRERKFNPSRAPGRVSAVRRCPTRAAGHR